MEKLKDDWTPSEDQKKAKNNPIRQDIVFECLHIWKYIILKKNMQTLG
jgi:hypothetical protein